jgi:hypothetical protein
MPGPEKSSTGGSLMPRISRPWNESPIGSRSRSTVITGVLVPSMSSHAMTACGPVPGISWISDSSAGESWASDSVPLWRRIASFSDSSPSPTVPCDRESVTYATAWNAPGAPPPGAGPPAAAIEAAARLAVIPITVR